MGRPVVHFEIGCGETRIHTTKLLKEEIHAS
jgi:hypothetical protein